MKILNKSFIIGLITGVSGVISAQETYTFTTCAATGQFGPSQGQVNTAYALTNLNGSVTSVNGVQNFTVPSTSIYGFTVCGAGSGNSSSFGGRGKIISGRASLVSGTVLKIIVGQKGINGGCGSASGGGGSFISTISNSAIIVAGGGGGFYQNPGMNVTSSDATISPNGNNSSCGSGFGGTNGNGGTGSNNGWGGGGGGFNTNGSNAINCNPTFGASFINGGQGGGTCYNAPGGFGGGAGTHGCTGGGGGGGGYSGGGGSNQNIGTSAGGGGGSYFSPAVTNTVDLGLNLNNGYVIIERLCSVATPTNTTPVNNSTVCTGFSATLSIVSTETVNNWYSDPTSTLSLGSGTTFVTPVLAAGVHTFYAAASTTCEGARAPITVTVPANPALAIAGGTNLVCGGTSVLLTASGAANYTWSTGAQTSTALVTPSVTTNYTVSSNIANCPPVTAVKTVSVYFNAIQISGAQPICKGQGLQLLASGGITYTWQPTNTFGQFTNVTPSITTTYTLTGFTNDGCNYSSTAVVSVSPLPAIAISGDNTICVGQNATLTASGADTYVWNTGATTSSITASPLATSNFTATGTNTASGCSNNAVFTVLVDPCTGLKEEASGFANIKYYPNPNNGEFTIELGNGKVKELILTDISGRVVKSIESSDDSVKININDLSEGVYYVKVISDNKSQTLQVIKQ